MNNKSSVFPIITSSNPLFINICSNGVFDVFDKIMRLKEEEGAVVV